MDNLISSAANSEISGYTFINGGYANAVSDLKNHCSDRVAAANSYLK